MPMHTSQRKIAGARRRSVSQPVQAPVSITAATTTQVHPPEVPIAPELLMQDAEASAAAGGGGVQTVDRGGESEWEYDWDDCEALPSPTPLVSYHNRIFSCDWTVPLGSEIFITSKEKSACVQQREAEVVGVGQIRLHGHPAIVTARSRAEDHRTTRTGAPGKGEGQLAAGKGGVGGRTAFWKRLEEVKRRKRETEDIDPAERDRGEDRKGEGEGEMDMEGAETGLIVT
ncbi:hypothetical protein BGX38DRAFT_1138172 [Terfezia claveryi]|nr:hypothetical protein BGX38DRAFT_1138172 [Terfezia claveryi]